MRPITQKTVQRRFIGREEITQIIRQELQSQHFFGQRKEAKTICYYCGKNGHMGGTQVQYAYGKYLN